MMEGSLRLWGNGDGIDRLQEWHDVSMFVNQKVGSLYKPRTVPTRISHQQRRLHFTLQPKPNQTNSNPKPTKYTIMSSTGETYKPTGMFAHHFHLTFHFDKICNSHFDRARWTQGGRNPRQACRNWTYVLYLLTFSSCTILTLRHRICSRKGWPSWGRQAGRKDFRHWRVW
jgi:hypothetical protein